MKLFKCLMKPLRNYSDPLNCKVYPFTKLCFLVFQVSKTLVINGRAALLGEQRNNTFCDVACGRGINSDITYCVTSSGLLCSINSKRVLDTWVELKVLKKFSVTILLKYSMHSLCTSCFIWKYLC